MNAPIATVLIPKPLLDRARDRCPICSTQFNNKNHKALCSHVAWSKKLKTFVLKHQKKSDDVQEQKYSLVPNWRRRLKERR